MNAPSPLIGDPLEPTVADRSRHDYTAGRGVIHAKVSPSGKKSQIGNGFSKFTNPQPEFIAVRDDTAHHYSVVSVNATGVLEMKVYSVRDDGSPRELLDKIRLNQPGK